MIFSDFQVVIVLLFILVLTQELINANFAYFYSFAVLESFLGLLRKSFVMDIQNDLWVLSLIEHASMGLVTGSAGVKFQLGGLEWNTNQIYFHYISY